MKYQVFGLVLIALAAVPSDAFLCFASTASPKISIFNVPGIELCPLGSRCISYRFEVNGFRTSYVRGCKAIPEGYDDFCKFIEEYGADECNSCRTPFCNWREIPLSKSDGEDTTSVEELRE